MIAPGIPFDEIDASHLQALIVGGYAERQTVEYKRELPKPSDSGKKEFLADASSFANASGGDLVYGIEAKDGVPHKLAPLSGTPDAEKLALQSSLQGGVSPRIPGVQAREIELDGGYALLFRIPRSWAGPHAVTFQGGFRFWARNSAGKYALDVAELRAAFLGGDAVAERVRAFRAERLAQIIAGETPAFLFPNPKVVVHLVPYQAFGALSSLELGVVERTGELRPPFDNYPSQTRWNIDGLLTVSRYSSEEPAAGYAQLYRNGIYEGVDAANIRTELHQQHRRPYVYGPWIEPWMNTDIANPLHVLEKVGVQTPIVVLVSVLGIKDYVMLAGERYMRHGDKTIDRDVLLLPAVILDHHLADPREELQFLMRPIVEAFWQAGGWPGSPDYDEAGIWRGVR